MKKLLLTLMVTGLIFTGLNCGSSAGGCTFDNSDESTGGAHNCWDYTGSGWETADAKTNCESHKGDFSEDGCDVSDSPGSCFVDKDKDSEIEIIYQGNVSGDKAKSACNSFGGSYETN